MFSSEPSKPLLDVCLQTFDYHISNEKVKINTSNDCNTAKENSNKL